MFKMKKKEKELGKEPDILELIPFKTVIEHEGEEHIFIEDCALGFLCGQCSLYDSKNDKCRIREKLLKSLESLGVSENGYSPCVRLGREFARIDFGTYFLKKNAYDMYISQEKEKQTMELKKTKCFDAEKVKGELVEWIRQWFEDNGKDCKAVIGISGGKDSTIVAGLCAEAIGKDRVLGVLMPCGEQKDIADSVKVCEVLGIPNVTVNIRKAYESVRQSVSNVGLFVSDNADTNINPRLRMTTLYAIAQSVHGRVVNTSNLSEYTLGYFTRYGDECGDLKPLINLTCGEVVAIGDELKGIPAHLIHKTPDDGLPNSHPDEEKFGFSYESLDSFIRNGTSGDKEVDIRIADKIDKVSFKHRPMSAFVPSCYSE